MIRYTSRTRAEGDRTTLISTLTAQSTGWHWHGRPDLADECLEAVDDLAEGCDVTRVGHVEYHVVDESLPDTPLRAVT